MARWRTSYPVVDRPVGASGIPPRKFFLHNIKPIACFRNNRIKTKVIQDDVSKFLPPGFKAPVEEQALSINKIFPSVKPTEAVAKDFKTSKVTNFFAFDRC